MQAPPPTWTAPVNGIEELADHHVHRPLASYVVRILVPTPVTPNQITVMSGIVGVLAGVALWFSAGRPVLRLVSAGLLFGSVVLDCTDGQLARARQQVSANGVILDGLADVFVGISVMLGAAHVAARYDHPPFVSLLGPAAIVSTFLQCFAFDVAKERYFATLDVRYIGSKRVLAAEVAERDDGGHDRLREGILGGIFHIYARIMTALVGGRGTAAALGAADLSRMRAWALLGQGTHMALLYTSAAISYFWPSSLYLCLLAFSTVMNAALFALLITESRGVTQACR